jgi:hypothetical protein
MMVKIFIANDELESKIIGRSFPQVTGSDSKPLFEENQKFNEAEKFKQLPKEAFSAKIAKSTKLTDKLSSFMSTHSPIVSEKFVELVKLFTVPDFILIPIQIYRVKELVIETKYFILHFLGNDIPNINFRESTFDYSTGGAFMDKSLLKFDSYEDYMGKLHINEVQMANIKKTVMRTSLKNDIFFLDILDGSAMYVTQRLKEAMEENKITGFRFEEVGYIED